MEQNNNKSLILWVVIILVVLVLLAYAVYYLRPQQEAQTVPDGAKGQPIVPAEDSVAAIDSDLQGLGVDGLDSELADIEKELQ